MFSISVIVKSRFKVILGLLFVVVLGLASRKYEWLFPQILGKYPGDALWAIAAYLGLKTLVPNGAPLRLGILALAISFIVEFSQLYHVAWLDEIRSNVIGHLFLGSTFNAIDLFAYSIGVTALVLIDCLLLVRTRSRVHSA